MNRRTVLMMVALIAVFTLLGSNSPVMAGGEPGSGGERIIGPTMWGVAVIDGRGVNGDDNPPYEATFRVKAIDGCEVKTVPINQESVIDLVANGIDPIESLPDVPGGEDDIIGVRIEAGAIFSSLPCVGVITKVKNLEKNGYLISFDAQVQFVANSNELECGQ